MLCPAVLHVFFLHFCPTQTVRSSDRPLPSIFGSQSFPKSRLFKIFTPSQLGLSQADSLERYRSIYYHAGTWNCDGGPFQHRLKSGDASGFKAVRMKESIGHTNSGYMISLWNSLGILERVFHANILDSAMLRRCGYLSWKSHHVLERHPL
jgi:hypothetical protein